MLNLYRGPLSVQVCCCLWAADICFLFSSKWLPCGSLDNHCSACHHCRVSMTPALSCWYFLLSASALVVLLCRHFAELSNYFCEHVGSGSVRRPLHLCSLRHHLALCRSHCCPALWPAVCFQRQRGESPLCVNVCVCVYHVHTFTHTLRRCVSSNPSLKCQTSPHSWSVKSIRGPEVRLPLSFTLRTFQLKVDSNVILELGVTSSSFAFALCNVGV